MVEAGFRAEEAERTPFRTLLDRLHPGSANRNAAGERFLGSGVFSADANGRLQAGPPWPDHEVSHFLASTSRNTEKVQEAPGQQAAVML